MSMRKEIIINKRKKKEKENIIWQSINIWVYILIKLGLCYFK